MRTTKTNFLLLTVLGLFTFLFSACNDDDVVVIRSSGYKSWFTVKVTDDGSYYFLHDKGKTFLPVSGLKYAPEKDHRAYVYYQVTLHEDSKEYNYPIIVHHMDTILSKSIAEDLKDQNKSVYGDDPVHIDRMWVGADFLNIRFSTYWGGHKAHFVNLVAENEENPYELRFRHNAYDDPKRSWGYGWVAFDLSTLPVSEDGEIELTIQVQTDEGLKEKTFTYIPGTENAEDPDGNDEEEDIDDTEPTAGKMI